MGRKPNAVIAAHFIRGEKHGQTTNRYAQTCRHCSHRFPTGRPETLLTHVANCPALSQDERADVVKQMFNTSSITTADLSSTQLDPQQKQINNMDQMDDFDISGLRVLAGAAENAEDMAIDPAISENEQSSGMLLPATHPLSYYNLYAGPPFSTAANDPLLSFAPPGYHYASAAPFQDVSSASAIDPALTATTTSSIPAVSFAPVLTIDSAYIAHPSSTVPVSFVDAQDQQQDNSEDTVSSVLGVSSSTNTKTRKAREPYDETKRAHVANMRHIGVCIRCSRLRKTCDPTRPCKACEQTSSKTWIGGCTTLHKGEEFTTWYGNNISNTVQIQVYAAVGENPTFSEPGAYLEIAFPYMGHGSIVFELMQGDRVANPASVVDTNNHFTNAVLLIKDGEPVHEAVANHAIDIQEQILAAIESPALYATARVAQGLSLEQAGNRNALIMGTAQQWDRKLGNIYDLWLTVTLLTDEHLEPTMTITESTGHNVNQALVDVSIPIIFAQLHTAIEVVAQESKEHLYKFDANILNQSHKHVFNLAIGMFLILDTVEKYCCFMNRKGYVTGPDAVTMVEQAKELAEVYAYCIHNIHMIPKPVFMGDTRMLAGETGSGRVNHDIQRVWMEDLCLSVDDLEEQLDRVDEIWTTPCGRLWAAFFMPLE